MLYPKNQVSKLKKELFQNPAEHAYSTFPCSRSFRPVYRRPDFAFSVMVYTVCSKPAMIISSRARVMAVYRMLRLSR